MILTLQVCDWSETTCMMPLITDVVNDSISKKKKKKSPRANQWLHGEGGSGRVGRREGEREGWGGLQSEKQKEGDDHIKLSVYHELHLTRTTQTI